ncbi:hypothetical protein Taro_007149 [Colocasia esculenta]|uniref:SCP domain-containing protein n=1 Tax=Colocasia esculenta TaxID=4460 RepID=A0A843TZE3_COLES|nr:hypothetical protein [Colocasia esculenta]
MARLSLPPPGAVLAMSIALVSVALAQNSPNDYLEPHNAARAEVGVDPLTWDLRLARYAQSYAEKRAGDCELVHSYGPYGENLFWGWGRPYTASDAVNSWTKEEEYYDYYRNSCDAGRLCGHYTQVVWADTHKVGCGRVRCDSGAYFIVCSYDPPGNVQGEWPYLVPRKNTANDHLSITLI